MRLESRACPRVPTYLEILCLPIAVGSEEYESNLNGRIFFSDAAMVQGRNHQPA